MRSLLWILLTSTIVAVAQTTPEQPASGPQAAVVQTPGKQVTVPAGTEVPLILKSAIDTKNTRTGDGVYCQTTFPVVVDNVMVIPAGTYVKGEVVKSQRAGRVKGRAEVLFRFNTLIFPNGYTVDMPGSIHHDSGASNASVDDEGVIKADPQKGKDAKTIGTGAGIGAAGGSIITGTRGGALGGAGVGGLAGLATVLLTRGQDVRIEPGTSLKMLLQRPLAVDIVAVDPNRPVTEVVPRVTNNNRLPTPNIPANPK
jgi:type F conjugative transfer system protein TrbI